MPAPPCKGRISWIRAARARHHNVLRRGTDRQRDLLVACVAIAVIVAITLSVLAALTCYRAQQATEQRKDLLVHAVRGVALSSAVQPASARGGPYSADVRWVDGSGGTHKAKAAVPPTTDAGDRVRLWLDRAGRVTSAPADDAAGNAVTLGSLTFLVLGAAVTAGAVVRRSRLNCIDQLHWEQEWRLVEPAWTHRRLRLPNEPASAVPIALFEVQGLPQRPSSASRPGEACRAGG